MPKAWPRSLERSAARGTKKDLRTGHGEEIAMMPNGYDCFLYVLSTHGRRYLHSLCHAKYYVAPPLHSILVETMFIPLFLAIGHCRISDFAPLNYSGTQGFPIGLECLQRLSHPYHTIPTMFALPDWDAAQRVHEPMLFLDFTNHDADEKQVRCTQTDFLLFEYPLYMSSCKKVVLCVIPCAICMFRFSFRPNKKSPVIPAHR
jgi:hypothetical protein